MSSMRISELASRTGVPASTLRFYEKNGLLPANRTAAGYRVYGDDAVERLAFIKAVKPFGLSLAEISALLAVWSRGTCEDVRAGLRPKLLQRITSAQLRQAELGAFTAAVSQMLRHLDTMPDRAERCDARCLCAGPGSEHLTGPSPEHPTGLGPEHPAGLSPQHPAGPYPGPYRYAGQWQAAHAATQSPLPSGRTAPGDSPSTAPIACSLDAAEVAGRLAEWHAALDGAERREIPDGVRLTVPAARASALAALAVAEQRCCPFFGFLLRLDGRVVHLEVRAPADAEDALRALVPAQTTAGLTQPVTCFH